MGGRGAMLQQKASTRIPEYKCVGFINGIKVLENLNGKNTWLPEMSNTPNTKYILKNKNGDFRKYREYDYSRRPILDIELDSKGLHIHYFKGDLGTRGRGDKGKTTETARPLTRKELKKHGKLLRALNVKI